MYMLLPSILGIFGDYKNRRSECFRLLHESFVVLVNKAGRWPPLPPDPPAVEGHEADRSHHRWHECPAASSLPELGPLERDLDSLRLLPPPAVEGLEIRTARVRQDPDLPQHPERCRPDLPGLEGAAGLHQRVIRADSLQFHWARKASLDQSSRGDPSLDMASHQGVQVCCMFPDMKIAAVSLCTSGTASTCRRPTSRSRKLDVAWLGPIHWCLHELLGNLGIHEIRVPKKFRTGHASASQKHRQC